ncbi:MAG: YitT family protein [Sphingobacteriales bacterium]|nr:YitT family protein [Sphingobacteriales bacterium]
MKKKSNRSKTKSILIDYLLLFIGILSAGFGLKGFLLPNNFIDGGAVGISLLIAHSTGIPLSVLLIVVNAPFIFLGIRLISKEFTVKAISGIILLALAVQFLPYPQITSDKLLVAVFGGFLLGAGIGFAVRGGGVIDGTEILAISLSRKTGMTIGDIILIINIIIFSVAAYLLSVENALYSMLTYLSASKTVDYIIEGVEEFTGITIISDKAEEIREMITMKLGRGVTIFKGEKGLKKDHASEPINIVYTVMSRLEAVRLSNEIELIDPAAFIISHKIKDTKGGMIKKRISMR